MKKIYNLFRNIIVFLVGQWLPPIWLRWIFKILFWPFTMTIIWISNQFKTPKSKKIAGGSAVFVVIAGIVGLVWWMNIPKAIYVGMSSIQLRPMPLQKGAKPMNFILSFSDSAVKLQDVIGKKLTSGITVSHDVAGTWSWQSDQDLLFIPEKDWPVNETITVKFAEDFFPNHINLRRHYYTFKTPEFKVQFQNLEFYQDPLKAENKKVVASFSFSHPVNPESFEENITIEMNRARNKNKPDWQEDNNFNLKITYDDFYGKAFIHTDRIESPTYDEALKLIVEDGIQSARGGNKTRDEIEREVTIPGMMSYFRINQIKTLIVRDEKNHPLQVLVIGSTARMKQKDLFNNLEVYLLPKDRPATALNEILENFAWRSPEQISEKILAVSNRIKLKPVPTEKIYESLLSFEMDEIPDRYIYIRIKKGIESFGDYFLAESVHEVLQIPKYPEELEILHKGSLLSLSGEKKISVMGRGVKAVRFRVSRFIPGQLAHLVSQTQGNFSSPYFKNHYSFNEDNIAEVSAVIHRFGASSPKEAQYTTFDFSNYLRKKWGTPKGLFLLETEAWNPVEEKTEGVASQRLILLTDLGLLVKKSRDGSYDLFVQSIRTGKPIPDASVKVLGKNGNPVLYETSDYQGHVKFPDLNDFNSDETPVAFTVTKDKDFSFIPYQSHVDRMNYSRFDVGGEYTQYRQHNLKAYLFSDRGLYRPGETINLGMIVKGEKWGTDLSDIPVELIVRNPRGLTIIREQIKLSALGFEEFSFSTSAASPTGVYAVNAYLIKKSTRRGDHIGSVTVKVEEFLPDRMKITAKYSKLINKGWISPKELKGLVNLQNLFGMPAANHTIQASITLQPYYPSFRAYRDYSFHDPSRSDRSFSERLIDQKTDEDGNSVFNLPLNKFSSATYLLKFFASGLELEGGRSVSTFTSVLVSPLEYLIGYKPDGSLNYIAKDSDRSIQFIALNSELEKQAVKNLKVQLVQLKHVSTLVRQPNGTYKYESVEKKEVLNEQAMEINKDGLSYDLPTNKPGDYLLVVLNQKDVELNQFRFSIAGEGDLAAQMDKNAELRITLNKHDFNPGEIIELQIKSPYKGSGLITIERDKVYSFKWFKTNKTSTIQRIKVPQGMEGNGYLNVTFARSINSSEIYMSPLSTAVEPFSINKSKRINQVTLKVPELVRPGDSLEIAYSSQKPGKIIIFAVDKGILQVAKYTTPNPLNHFLKKKALEVETRQILDLILPEYSIATKKRYKAGGGVGALLAKNLNPFRRKTEKPVVYWSGLLDVDTTMKKLKFTVPDYFNGQLKFFAVSLTPDAMGVVSDQTFVRGHFVLSPNIPTFVAPNDHFTLSVGIANNVEKSGKEAPINLVLNTSNHFEVLGDKKQLIKIDENTEKSAKFEILVKDHLGSGSFSFTASLDDKNAKRTIDASVRPPIPYQTVISSGVINSGKTEEVLTPRKLYPRFNNNEIGVSSLPLGLAGGLVNYLAKYPYGCSEQIVSKGFPALILSKKPEFGFSKKKIDTQLTTTLAVMRSRMNANGGVGIWESSTVTSPYHTAYFVHFLTEANEIGFSVPKDLLMNGLRYLKKFSEKESKDLAMARTQAYSVYLLTRNDVLATKALVQIKSFLQTEFKKEWESDLSLLYMAASYQLMKSEEADKLIGRFHKEKSVVPAYGYDLYNQMTRDALYLFITSKHFPDIARDIDRDDLSRIVDPLLKGNYNTLSSSLSILGLNAYADLMGQPEFNKITVNAIGLNETKATLKFPEAFFAKTQFPLDSNKLEVKNESAKDLFYSLTQAGFDHSPENAARNNVIEVVRVLLDKNNEPVTRVKIGDEVDVVIRIRTIDKSYQYNIAIVDLLPGGFEIVPESINRRAADYMDIREDRVVIFTSAAKKVKEFDYRIKAVNKGKFTLPPLYGESMYDRKIRSISTSGQILVN